MICLAFTLLQNSDSHRKIYVGNEAILSARSIDKRSHNHCVQQMNYQEACDGETDCRVNLGSHDFIFAFLCWSSNALHCVTLNLSKSSDLLNKRANLSFLRGICLRNNSRINGLWGQTKPGAWCQPESKTRVWCAHIMSHSDSAVSGTLLLIFKKEIFKLLVYSFL